MKNILFRKGFVITLVGLLIIISFSPLASSIAKNEKNREIIYGKMHTLSGNGIICGYVTDTQTSLPIENAKVDVQRWSTYWNHTYTDSSGFYSISVPATNSIRLHVHADGYLSKYKGFYDLDENEILWVNVSLLPRAPETSIIYGYVKDKETGEPIEGAKVKLRWRDEDWNHYYNNTYTDSLGFYQMNVAAGKMILYATMAGYFTQCWPQHSWYNMGENETKQANISMYSIPPENSIVCGYITDSKTSDPIEDAHVYLHWQDGHGHSRENDTFTDSLGFYSMNIATGNFRLKSINKKGYWNGCTPYYDIGENETLWLNKSLDPRAPENAMVYGYITNASSGEPIEGAGIHLDWKDREGHIDWNWTNTNASGYYSFNVAEGKIKLKASKDGYYSREKGWYDIDANEKKRVDFELCPGIPSKPQIWGPTKGGPGVEYDYNFVSWDDEEYVWYYIEWGDGVNTSWLGPYPSGETIVVNHSWNETGRYTIRAKAKDIDGRKSGWGTLEVRMPKNKMATNSVLSRLLGRYSNAFPILRKMMGR